MVSNAVPLNGNNWLSESVIFNVTLGKLGNSRKLASTAVETDSDREMIAVNKKLFRCDEYQAVVKKHGEIRQYVYARSVPCFFLRAGSYMVKNTAVREIDNGLQRLQRELNALVDQFIAVYPAAIRDAETQLRSNFNPAEYLGAEEARKQFIFAWSYLQVGVPDGLDRDLFARETANLQQRCETAFSQINDLLLSEFADLVTHMEERLSGDRDGKPKIFRDSLVENVREFLATYPFRNITNSAQLDAVIARASELLAGVTPDKLRESDSLRARIVQGFGEMKSQLDTMLAERPARAISFEE